VTVCAAKSKLPAKSDGDKAGGCGAERKVCFVLANFTKEVALDENK